MPRKPLTMLAAILANTSLAVMPALAQATPRYYKNGTLIPQGEKVAVVEWGKFTLAHEPGLGAVPTCEASAGGYVENPVGGGAGTGQTSRFASWNCIDAECPAGSVEIGGKSYEKEWEYVYPPQSFPWPSVLTEAEPGVVRTNTTGLVMKIACVAHGLSRSAAGEGGPSGAGESEQYVLPSGGPPTVTCVTDETHKQQPRNENGVNAGPNQSKVSFVAGSSELSCAGGAFESQFKESMKVVGFKNSELITAH